MEQVKMNLKNLNNLLKSRDDSSLVERYYDQLCESIRRYNKEHSRRIVLKYNSTTELYQIDY